MQNLLKYKFQTLDVVDDIFFTNHKRVIIYIYMPCDFIAGCAPECKHTVIIRIEEKILL